MLSDLSRLRHAHPRSDQRNRVGIEDVQRRRAMLLNLSGIGPRRLLGNAAIARNALFLGANVLAGLCSYLLHAILGRVIGPAGYGIVASLIALSTIGLIPAHIIGTVVTSHVAHLRVNGCMERANDLVRRLSRLLLPVGGAIAALIALAAVPIATFLRVPSALDVALTAITFMVAFAAPINTGAALGLERYRWYAASIALPSLLRLLLSAALAFLGYGLHGAVAGIAFSTLFAYGLTFPPLIRLLKGSRVAFGPLIPLWRKSIMTAVAITGITLLYTTDTILAKHFLSDAHAGLYAAVTTASKIILMFAFGIICVLLPKFSTVVARSDNPIPAVAEGLLATGALCVPATAACMVVPALTLRILVGPAFIMAAPYLPLYAVSTLLLSFAQVFIYYFLAAGTRRFIPTIVACCGLHGALIWLHHSGEGDLVHATFLSTALLLVVMIILFVHHAKSSGHGISLSTATLVRSEDYTVL